MVTRLVKLKDILKTLASDPGSQLKYLEETGAPKCVDELALDYDDIAIVAADMVRQDEITREASEYIKRLLEYFKSFSGEANAPLWTPEALYSAEEWKRVRSIAKEILTLLE